VSELVKGDDLQVGTAEEVKGMLFVIGGLPSLGKLCPYFEELGGKG